MKKLVLFGLLGLLGYNVTYAQKVITIAKDTKVYEAPQARDEYAAQNSNGDNVILKEGMCFEVKEEKGGWYVIEYTNGLRGNVMQNTVVSPDAVKMPAAGKYTVNNSPSQSSTLSKVGDDWNLTIGSKNLKGKTSSNVILFQNEDGSLAYSLTMLNGKPYLFCYDNSVTHFF